MKLTFDVMVCKREDCGLRFLAVPWIANRVAGFCCVACMKAAS